MNDHANPSPSTELDVSILTPDDTWCVWIDSYDMRRHWATVLDETVVVRDGTDTTNDEVLRWSVELADDETGEVFTIDHSVVLAAMHRIALERDASHLADTTADQIATVLDADDHEDAVDELCQLDAASHDVIIQIATLGQVIYG